MFSKIVFKNIKKNISDYLIYFFTLMFAVSLFYSFNSIESQTVFTSLSSTKSLLANQLNIFIGILSNIIAVILAFLIIYGNQFLIKRRNKELGIYMTLGMDKWKISSIFAGENLIIGIMSLSTGLIVGFILSQFLSLVSLKLFAIDLSNYKILFSINALKKTIVCFTIIYLIVIIFSVKSVSKISLIDMINASKKNESLKLKGKRISILLMFISIVEFIISWYLVNRDGILPTSDSFNYIVILFCTAIALFFYSSSSIVFNLIKSSKSIYLKNLNTFLIRQLSTKIQSNFISMTILCIILTITISVTSLGMSIALTMNNRASMYTPYDMTVFSNTQKLGDIDTYEYMKNKNFPIDKYLKDYIEVQYYESDIKYKDIVGGNEKKLWKLDKNLPDLSVQIVTISDFNKAMKLQGKSELKLDDDSFIINCNYKGTKQYVEDFLNRNKSIKMNGQVLYNKSSIMTNETINMTSIDNNDRGTIIVPDSIVKYLEKDTKVLSGLYKDNVNPDSVVNDLVNFLNGDFDSGFKYTTKSMMYDMYYGMQAMVSFICSYIGLVFLIISGSILALQQLTETADNIHRYKIIKKLGTDKITINKTLFKQIGFYFTIPLFMASIFSSVCIRKSMEITSEFLNMDIDVNIAITVILFLVIYFSYFIATYISAKKIIADK